MKSFKTHIEEVTKDSSHDERNAWVGHQMHNTEKTHDQIKKEFHKKYPQHKDEFEKHVNHHMDM